MSPTPVQFSVRGETNNELWSVSKNTPFHSQTRQDIDEFKKRIEEQEKRQLGFCNGIYDNVLKRTDVS
jgi:hypothetical protein